MSQKCNRELKSNYTVRVISYAIMLCRKKEPSKKSLTERLVSKMANHKGKEVTADVTSGNMVFEPILENGVFRFDCSANDRDAAYPSFSFVDSKVRDTAVIDHRVPSYIPDFKCQLGQQIVNFEVSKHFVVDGVPFII